jgi:hypothetical protein
LEDTVEHTVESSRLVLRGDLGRKTIGGVHGLEFVITAE